MTKSKTQFICQNCGHVAVKWSGKCPECHQWNSFEEELTTPSAKRSSTQGQSQAPKKIEEVEKEHTTRMTTQISEFDRVVGGGLAQGSLTLIGGQPGIGKSTLLMEVCGKLARQYPDNKVFYVSGEESEGQVAQRCKRLGVVADNILIFNNSSWQTIKAQLKKIRPLFFVLDSIQTTSSEEIASPPGTMSQVREVTYEVMNYAKATNTTSFIIGHVTKEGNIAGPKLLEHMVDTVIYFEGDNLGQYRMLRAIKNRYGNTNEVGIFEMSDKGLHSVANPSQCFLDNPLEDSFGRSLTCILEGTRPLLMEVQALVVDNKWPNPRRTTQGIDNNRLAMLVAVVEKYFGIPLGLNDIYVNIVGGVKLNSRESDLAILASLLSSLKSSSIDERSVFIGEVGLTGEVRTVPQAEKRLKELEQLNYKSVYTAHSLAKRYCNQFKLKLIGLKKASELIGKCF